MSNRLGFGWLALSCLLFLETGVATASDPEDDADAPGGLVEEFFQLESSHVQERGEWQLGITTQTDSNDDPEIAPLQLEAEYGVTDRWQLGVEIAYQAEGPVPGDESGWGNPSFGTQVELFSARSSVFSIAAEREVGDGEEEAWEAALLGSTRLAAVELSWIAASSLEDGLEEA